MIASVSPKNIKAIAIPKVAVPTPPQISLYAGQRLRATVTVTNIGQDTDWFGLMGWLYPPKSGASYLFDRAYPFLHVGGADGFVVSSGIPVMHFYLGPGQSRQVTVQTSSIYQYEGYTTFGIFWQAGVLVNLNDSSMTYKNGTIDSGRWDNVVSLV